MLSSAGRYLMSAFAGTWSSLHLIFCLTTRMSGPAIAVCGMWNIGPRFEGPHPFGAEQTTDAQSLLERAGTGDGAWDPQSTISNSIAAGWLWEGGGVLAAA